MESVISTLSSSLVLDPVQHACAKLVSGIATYGVQRCTEEEEMRDILQSLCVPLSKCLLENRDSLIYGSALCLEALVDSVNWKFASSEMVNDVCLKVAVALEEKHTQTIAHMGLAMALAKHNNLTLEPYARSLIRSGIRILNAKVEENDSRTKVTVIQMVNILMKSVDPRSVFSELEIVVKEMENCCTDRITKGAAFEAMKTARTIIWKNGLGHHGGSGLISGTKFGRSCRNENARGLRGQSVPPMSPDSQSVYSSFERDFSNGSILSRKQLPKFGNGRNFVKRRLWKEIGSLRNASHSFMESDRNSSEIDPKYFSDGEVYENEVDSVVLSGFPRSTPRRRVKTQSECYADDMQFYTPRRVPRKIPKTIRRPLTNQLESSLAGKEYGNPNFEIKANNNYEILRHSVRSRSASSTSDKAANKDFNVSHKVNSEYNALSEPRSLTPRASTKVGLILVIGLSIIILAVILFPMWTDNQSGINFFPT
ncbi:hypothetical protein ACHQM5_013260 [Ranunculus cassubicifolius]